MPAPDLLSRTATPIYSATNESEDSNPTRLDRRQLLFGLAGVIGGRSPASIAQSQSITGESAGEYLFAPGLVYLNTAALGPTTRSILERTLHAWKELESDPVMMAYGDGAVHAATDTAREQIAALINCTTDEILITRSATTAMNSLALGMNLSRGDRVLTTDVEHEGGSNGWFYLKRRVGVGVALVTIGPHAERAHPHDQRYCGCRAASSGSSDRVGFTRSFRTSPVAT